MFFHAVSPSRHLAFYYQLTSYIFGVFLVCLFSLFSPASHAQDNTSANNADTTDTSYAAVADLLENQETRDALIEQLRSLANKQDVQTADQPSKSDQVDDTTTETPKTPSISDRISQHAQIFTVTLVKGIGDTADIAHSLVQGKIPPQLKDSRWTSAITILLITIVLTVVAWLILRIFSKPLYKKLDTRASHVSKKYPVLHKLIIAIIGLVINTIAIIIAALIGYVVVMITGDANNNKHTLFALSFLTSFVLIETAKAVCRTVFASNYEHLRLLPINTESATYWNYWISLLIGTVGYGLTVLVPVGIAIMGTGVGQVINLLLMLVVYVYGIGIVWKNSKKVSNGLVKMADQTRAPIFGTLLRVLSHTWHWLASLYLTVLLISTQASQSDALTFMMQATVQTLIAVIGGLLLGAIIKNILGHRLHLPSSWNKSLPLLESRLNSYLPIISHFLRSLITIVVILLVLDAWRVFDLAIWLQSDGAKALTKLIFHIVFVLAFATLSWVLLASIIEHRISGGRRSLPSEREKTLLILFRNAATIIIITLTILVLLSQIGIDIAPLIAGAGVAGLAIGFGAQKLVQDVITGIFIQLENGMNQNDIVEVAGIFGTVEKITIRSVGIRTMDGGYHLIPFSSIDKVSNHTRDFAYHYGEYVIPYNENIDQATEQLRLAFADIKSDDSVAAHILSDIELPGVSSLSDKGISIRVLIRTSPAYQWAVGRAFNKQVKNRFDANNIKLAYPHTVVHMHSHQPSAQEN